MSHSHKILPSYAERDPNVMNPDTNNHRYRYSLRSFIVVILMIVLLCVVSNDFLGTQLVLRPILLNIDRFVRSPRSTNFSCYFHQDENIPQNPSMKDYHKFLPQCFEDCEGVETTGRPYPTCCRARQVRLLEIAFNLLPKYNLSWFITDGNLLGCLRHGGQIFHDSDVDIAVLVEFEKDLSNYKKFQKAYRPLTSFRGGEHLDFYFLTPIEGREYLLGYSQPYDTKGGRIVSSYPETEFDNEGIKPPKVWNRSEFFPVKTCRYFDRDVPCPRDAVAVVERMYGLSDPEGACKIVRKWCNWKKEGAYTAAGQCDYKNQKREESDMFKSQQCLKKYGYPHLDCIYDFSDK